MGQRTLILAKPGFPFLSRLPAFEAGRSDLMGRQPFQPSPGRPVLSALEGITWRAWGIPSGSKPVKGMAAFWRMAASFCCCNFLSRAFLSASFLAASVRKTPCVDPASSPWSESESESSLRVGLDREAEP